MALDGSNHIFNSILHSHIQSAEFGVTVYNSRLTVIKPLFKSRHVRLELLNAA